MMPGTRPGIVIGLDVGKSSHWACVVACDGEILASRPVANRESAVDELYSEYPGALVVVDQVRNIGALALSRARLAGMPRAYLPGLAAHGASKLFAGDAKTDERDAMVIAKTALGIPDPSKETLVYLPFHYSVGASIVSVHNYIFIRFLRYKPLWLICNLIRTLPFLSRTQPDMSR